MSNNIEIIYYHNVSRVKTSLMIFSKGEMNICQIILVSEINIFYSLSFTTVFVFKCYKSVYLCICLHLI